MLARARLTSMFRRTFGSLDTYNYRLYFGGNLVSYVGSWMQTMAEAWLVLTLTGNGAAVLMKAPHCPRRVLIRPVSSATAEVGVSIGLAGMAAPPRGVNEARSIRNENWVPSARATNKLS